MKTVHILQERKVRFRHNQIATQGQLDFLCQSLKLCMASGVLRESLIPEQLIENPYFL